MQMRTLLMSSILDGTKISLLRVDVAWLHYSAAPCQARSDAHYCSGLGLAQLYIGRCHENILYVYCCLDTVVTITKPTIGVSSDAPAPKVQNKIMRGQCAKAIFCWKSARKFKFSSKIVRQSKLLILSRSASCAKVNTMHHSQLCGLLLWHSAKVLTGIIISFIGKLLKKGKMVLEVWRKVSNICEASFPDRPQLSTYQ